MSQDSADIADTMNNLQAGAPALVFSPVDPIINLVSKLGVPYHTDGFITKTLNFKPTQLENILRNNYNNAAKRVLDSQFDGAPQSGPDADFISISDVMQELFPDVETFIEYLKQRTPSSKFPVALSFIISRKAAADSKRQELHEFAMEEMRSILQMPNEIPDPDFKPSGPDDVAPMITDYKTLNLKAGIFKHLDSQKNKQIIHEQNFHIKINQLNLKGGNGGKNPTLIGYGDVLPHNKLQGPKRRISANPSSAHESEIKAVQSPKQILDDIISDDSVIDVTPRKEELLKEDETALAEKLSNLRLEEAKAMRIPTMTKKEEAADDTF